MILKAVSPMGLFQFSAFFFIPFLVTPGSHLLNTLYIVRKIVEIVDGVLSLQKDITCPASGSSQGAVHLNPI